MIGLSDFLLNVLAGHSYLISFVVGMLSEEVLFFLAVLSASGSFPFWALFFFGFLGIIVADSALFFLGHTKFFQHIRHNYFKSKRYHRIKRVLSGFTDRLFIFLLVSKFIYGTRAAATLFLGVKKMKYRTFILLDIVAVLIWEAVMLPIAWLAGKGIYSALKVTKGFERFLLVALLLLVIYHLIIKNITERLRRIPNNKV